MNKLALALLSCLLAAPAVCAPPTVKEAEGFISRAEEQLEKLGRRASFSTWAMQTNINYSTEWLSADADNAFTSAAAWAFASASAVDEDHHGIGTHGEGEVTAEPDPYDTR